MFNARQRSLTPTLLFFVLSAAAFGQSPKPDWSDWKFMLGEWTAIQSSGMPGSASTASFSLVPDLQGMILLRKNHAEYPPAIVHEDLMVVYREDGKTRAFYEDTEGHIIRYEIAVADKKIVMLSEMIAGAPRFRLTYTTSRPDALDVAFEIAPPNKPDEFKVYAQGTVVRKK